MTRDPQGHFYGSRWLDRSAHLRGNADWVAERLVQPSTRLVPVWHSRNLLHADREPRAVYPVVDGLGAPSTAEITVLLGVDREDRAWFAVVMDGETEPTGRLGGDDVRFASLRRTGPLLPASDAAALAYARAMGNWHDTHRFCGVCGSRTEVRQAGWLRVCTRASCGRQHFPRTDPAVIVRVTHSDRILLGRQANWPERWYSVLAGFVEPGESLEDAVAREIMEEAGVQVHSVAYDSSQPWPFPQSIMLGFSAVADNDDLCLHDQELADARWFTREQIIAGRDSGQLRLSPETSISRHLVDVWLASPELP